MGLTLLLSQQVLGLFLWKVSGFEDSLYSMRTYDEGVTEIVDPELVHDRGAAAERSLRQRIVHVRGSDGQSVQDPFLRQRLLTSLCGRCSRHKIGAQRPQSILRCLVYFVAELAPAKHDFDVEIYVRNYDLSACVSYS
jgi:hypothetical protein